MSSERKRKLSPPFWYRVASDLTVCNGYEIKKVGKVWIAYGPEGPIEFTKNSNAGHYCKNKPAGPITPDRYR